MAHPYLPQTPADIEAMTRRCGLNCVEDLLADIPAECRFTRAYDIPERMGEHELRGYFKALGALNKPLACFAGAGFYHHYTPAAVEAIVARSEFLTAYTPYQPEISQGTLQYIFEYQSMMAELTGMEVCNASMYDGTTATAEAMLMAVAAAKKKRRVLLAATVPPATAQVLATYAEGHGIVIETIPEDGGVADRTAFADMMGAGDVAAVIVASPNYYGILEDYEGWADVCHKAKALFVISSPASPLAVIRTPAEWGADIACGEAQSLGIPLNYGGPGLGYLCTGKTLMRKMPGRLVGATTDADGQRVFVLTLQAREQHIRRQKATSNICSNQGIMTLYAAAYMALMGREGLVEVNRRSRNAAHALVRKLCETGHASLCYPDKPFFNEAALRLESPVSVDTLLKAAAAEGILAGVKLTDDTILVAATETATPAQIDRYARILSNLYDK